MRSLVILTILAFCVAGGTADGSAVYIGGAGAISTDDAYGGMGLLSGGETGTATFGYAIATTVSGVQLTFTVTNTSPAVLGTDALVIPDAPVISDMFFGVPSAVTGMTFLTAGGTAAASSGWDFIFDADNAPSTGFGFLKKVFDVGLEGGPGAGSPDPVISSIYDPNIYDGSGDPLASPVAFIFTLAFAGGSAPAGFSADWFADYSALGGPDYIAAAKFMSGANGGSATVTNGDPPPVVPEPASISLVLAGLLAAGFGMNRSRFAK